MRPSVQPPRQVARAVQPRARLAAERVRDEALRRQLRPAQVAARHARPADVQLARHAHRHRLPVPVQHVHLRVRQRPADAAPTAPPARAPRQPVRSTTVVVSVGP